MNSRAIILSQLRNDCVNQQELEKEITNVQKIIADIDAQISAYDTQMSGLSSDDINYKSSSTKKKALLNQKSFWTQILNKLLAKRT